MAFRRKVFKSKKRVVKKRMPVVRVPNNTIGRTLGFPPSLKFKHVYYERFNLTGGIGTISTHQHRCNGMFDPNHTGVGSQPSRFDTLSALYNHYRVIGSKVTYSIIPSGSVDQKPYRIITSLNDDFTITATQMDTLSEQKGSKTKICSGGVGTSACKMTNSWSLAKMFPLAKGDRELGGTPITDPTEQTIYALSLQALDAASPVDVWVIVRIEYIAVWNELKDLVSS